MKPKLLIDTIPLLSPLTGIGRYTYEISKHITSRELFEVTYFYGYYSKNLIGPSSHSELKGIKTLLTKYTIVKKIVRKILLTASQIFASSYDLYWQPSFIPNKGIKAKKIITTVHDFSFLQYRNYHPKERIDYFETYFNTSVIQSNMIITGSKYTKQEIVEKLDFSEEKIKVIYHGIDHTLFKVYETHLTAIEVPSQFILSVGSIEPRKNLLGLLKAYILLDEKIKKEYPLILTGFKGWENKEIMKIIEQNREYIQYLGFVSDEALADLYNRANLFVFPSFYEGFGLPPLEAMACGTPVIASQTSSMPEICVDAAIYCDPYDEKDISKKIMLVLQDTSLQQSLIRKGLSRASKFTWERAAKEHLAVFQEVLTQ